VKDASARLAIVEAIDALSPGGDAGAADALDKIVASDTTAGDKNVLMADDSVVKIALRLRARSP
jgi:sulfur relay (sulfurtransferase) DsrF/TusC family protein